MILPVIPFPAIDPVLISVGPLAIRWYSLAYIAGFLLAWRYMRLLLTRYDENPPLRDRRELDDLLICAAFGVILGGRIGYGLFYGSALYSDNPLRIFAIWEGGMSFHGGAAGVLIAVALFCRKRGLSFTAVGDLVACATPIGLFFGRIANFINGELYGRVTDVPWAMVFPGGGPFARHPSQLYEALLEGLVLFILLAVMHRNSTWRTQPGRLGGLFLVGYTAARLAVETVREPDSQLGLIWGPLTMGQILSIPFAVAGLYLIFRSKSRHGKTDD